jgi:hypothetical protein
VRAAALSTLVYLCLALVAGLDVLRGIDDHIASDAGDPLLNTAILTWNTRHLPLSDAWWQFPIFHPTRDVLAFSEHLLGLSVLAAPLEWLSGNPLVSYNVTLLLSYPLTGLAAYLLVFRLTRSTAAAFLSGLAFAFAPYRASQLPHIQLLVAAYSPLVLLGLHGFLDTGRRAWLVLFGAAWLLQAAANGYLLIFGSVLLALWLLWFVVAPGRWRDLRRIVLVVVVASVPLVPILTRYAAVHARHGFVRGFDEAALFSLDFASMLCASPRLSVWGWLRIGCRPEADAFPGITLVALCAMGLWWARRQGATQDPGASGAPSTRARGDLSTCAQSELERWTRIPRRILWSASAIFALAAVVTVVTGGWQVAIGPIAASSSSPAKPVSVAVWLSLAASLLLPRLRAMAHRASVTGFYLLAAAALWILALGPSPAFLDTQVLYEAPFAWLMRLPGGNAVRAPGRLWLLSMMCLVVVMGVLVARMLNGRTRRVAIACVAIASCGLVLDGWSWIPAVPAPAAPPRPDLLRGGVVLELPAGDTLQDIAAVYRATTGGWRTVNGFSGYEPAWYQQLREASLAGRGVLDQLEPFDTLHVIVPEQAPALVRLVEAHPRSELVGQSGGLVQYRVRGK